MYGNRRERSVEKHTTFPPSRRTLSFSSSLLDSIYRSFDESKVEEDDLGSIRKTDMPKKKQSNSYGSCFKEEKERNNLQRDIMIENWVERQSVRSSSFLSNSASSSLESSSGAAWSSSETESNYKQRTKSNQLRTGDSVLTPKSQSYMQHFKERYLDKEQNQKREIGTSLTKTKLKALKIYGELKKVKQPISPGGRIASFINSIFNSGNVKKGKMCSSIGAVEDVSSNHATKSASTFSRSCLSNPTSSTRSKQSNGVKRSVRFYPVSVVLGEDSSQPCGNKCIYEADPSLIPLPSIQNFGRSCSLKKDKTYVLEKRNGIERTARDILGGYCNEELLLADDEDEDEDAESYSSSDLFELDHLVGIGRYREELPVYETTNMKTNQAIANGFIL